MEFHHGSYVPDQNQVLTQLNTTCLQKAYNDCQECNIFIKKSYNLILIFFSQVMQSTHQSKLFSYLRMLTEALVSTKALGQAENFDTLKEFSSLLHTPFDVECDHTTVTFHLPFSQLMLRVRRQSWKQINRLENRVSNYINISQLHNYDCIS